MDHRSRRVCQDVGPLRRHPPFSTEEPVFFFWRRPGRKERYLEPGEDHDPAQLRGHILPRSVVHPDHARELVRRTFTSSRPGRQGIDRMIQESLWADQSPRTRQVCLWWWRKRTGFERNVFSCQTRISSTELKSETKRVISASWSLTPSQSRSAWRDGYLHVPGQLTSSCWTGKGNTRRKAEVRLGRIGGS